MLDCIKYHLENSEVSLIILVFKFCKTVVSKIYDQSLLLSAGFFFFFSSENYRLLSCLNAAKPNIAIR